MLLAGCIPEHPAIVAARDPWPDGARRIDSLAAAGRDTEALAGARARLRLAELWGEPPPRVAEARALERSLARAAKLPAAGRAALAAAGREVAAARADSAADSLAAAAAHWRAAWTARREWLGGSDLRTALAALGLADAEFALAHVHEADSLARVAGAGLAAALGADHPRLADVEELLGRVVKNYTGRAGFELARAHYDAALRVRVRAEGPGSLPAAETMQDLANLYRLDRRTEEAYALFESALETRRARLGPVHDDVASTLGGMAVLRAGQGRWGDVARLAREALAATPTGAGIPAGARGSRLGLLGQALLRLGRDGDAVRALREAVALRESVWARTSRDEGSTVIAGLGMYRDLAMALAAAGRGEEAFEQLARGSSRTLTRRLLGTDSARADPWRGVLPRVQAELADDEALVSWVRTSTTVFAGDYPMWACVVRSRGPVRWYRLERVGAPRPRVTTVRDALWGELRAASTWPRRVEDTGPVDRMAQRMWQEWFAPLEPGLAGVSRLVVCAPDLVAGGPLAALRDDRGRWLSERFTISYAPSALLFVHGREQARAPGRALARAALLVGDPAYAADDPERWPRLPGSTGEMRAIAARWPVATLLTGTEARAASLRALASSGSLSGYGLLHFAAHAEVDTRRPLDAAIVLAPDLPGGRDASRLRAREVAGSWALNADLVCLAGCQTSIGLPSASDGALGLQEAFLAAGARSLLVTLWPVDDRATARLMESFYARLAEPATGGDRARALAAAQADLRAWRTPDGRHPYAHPAYWAPFVLVGDPGGAGEARLRRRASPSS